METIPMSAAYSWLPRKDMIQNLVLNYCPCFTYSSSFLFTHQNDSDVCREVRHLLFLFLYIKISGFFWGRLLCFQWDRSLHCEVALVEQRLAVLHGSVVSLFSQKATVHSFMDIDRPPPQSPLFVQPPHRTTLQLIPSWTIDIGPSVFSLYTVPTQNTMTHSVMNSRHKLPPPQLFLSFPLSYYFFLKKIDP